jgi:hypothetical protein
VNVKNAIVWNAGDDALDTDQAWSGTLDNFIVVCGDQTDHALEIDGPEGSANAGHNLINGWVKGHPVSELGDFRSKAQGSFKNIYFFNFDAGIPAGRGDLSLDAATVPNFGTTLTFDKLEVTTDTMTISKIFKNGTVAHATKVTTPTVGANTAAFAGWSWAAKVEAYK